MLKSPDQNHNPSPSQTPTRNPVLDKKIQISVGTSVHKNAVKTQRLTVGDVFNTYLLEHKVGKKDGPHLSPAVYSRDIRRDENASEANTIWFDFDNGTDTSELIEKARKSGYLCSIYNTYSHGSRTTTVPKSTFAKYVSKSKSGLSCPSLEAVMKDYLLNKKNYNPEIFDAGLTVEEGEKEYIVTHGPVQKTRLVFFLDTPLKKNDNLGQKATKTLKADYTRTVERVAHELGLENYDRASTRLTQPMFTPRVPSREALEEHGHICEIINEETGRAVDIDQLPNIDRKPQRKKPAQRPIRNEKGREDDVPKLFGADPFGALGFRETFKAAEFIECVGECGGLETDRVPYNEQTGKASIECPFEGHHTPPESGPDVGFYGIDYTHADEGKGIIGCRHDGCAHHKTDFWMATILDQSNEDSVDLALDFCDSSEDKKKVVRRYIEAERLAVNEDEVRKRLESVSEDTSHDEIDVIITAVVLRNNEFLKGEARKKLKDNANLNVTIFDGRFKSIALEYKEFEEHIAVHENSSRLDELNKRYGYVVIGGRGRIVRLPDSHAKRPVFWTVDGFHHYHENDRVPTANGQSTSISRVWMSSPDRRTYDEVGFDPSRGDTPNFLNLWRGFSVSPSRGNWSLFRQHVFENLCQEDPFLFSYVMCWLADMIQNPCNKPGVALVLRGEKGTGKSKVTDWVSKLLQANSIKVSQRSHLLGHFNDQLSTALLVVVEEAFWAGDKAAEGVLKDLATGDTMMHEKKGVDATQINNYVHLIINSNEDWVVPASLGERRFVVIDVSSQRQKDTAFFKGIDEQMGSGGLEAMLYDLQHLKQPNWIELRDAPRTAGLADQIENSLEPHELYMCELLRAERSNLLVIPESEFNFLSLVNLKDFSIRTPPHSAETNPIRPNDLFRVFQEFCEKINKPYAGRSPRKLAKLVQEKFGVEKKKLTVTSGERANFYVFPSLNEMRKKFTDLYGIQVDDSGHTEPLNQRKNDIDPSELEAWTAYGQGSALPEAKID